MVIWEEGKKTILGELEKVWCILRVFAYSSHLRAACNGLFFLSEGDALQKGAKRGAFHKE